MKPWTRHPQLRQARVEQADVRQLESGVGVAEGLVDVEERVIDVHVAEDEEAEVNEGGGVAFHQHGDVDAVACCRSDQQRGPDVAVVGTCGQFEVEKRQCSKDLAITVISKAHS